MKFLSVGAHWRQALRGVSSNIELTAIVPAFGGGTASLEERYADLPRFDTVEALIAAGEFDGAVVCLPNDVGPDAMIALARAGKHILAEKPVAGSGEDARQIAEAVGEGGIAFQNGYMWRYDEAVERLRRMVHDGSFGKLISVEMAFVTSDVKRRGPDHYLFDAEASCGGFFSWLACHFLDLLMYVTGEQVFGVTARCGVFGETPADVEDGGVAILDLAGGGIATFLGGYWLPRWAGESRWTLRGSERWVHWDPSRTGTGGVLEIHGPKPQWHAMEEEFIVPVDETPGYGGRKGAALIEDWIDAARQGGRACRNTAASTVATLELIDAIYESSREGRRIECRIGVRDEKV